MVDTKHPLATYLRVIGFPVRPTTFGGQGWGSRQELSAVDSALSGAIFQASVCRDLLAAMSSQSTRRAKPSPEEFLKARLAVRFAEYRGVMAQHFPKENPIELATAQGAKVVDRAGEEFPEARRIWQEVASEAI